MSEWTPTIYDLRNDTHAARFGLQPWERDQLLRKRIDNRDGARPEVIGLHVQWGNSIGSLRYWLGVPASSTIMVQSDGSILKVIPEEHGPWTQGDIRHPDAQALKLMGQFGQGDFNPYSLTIEAEDHRTETINEEQLHTILWVIRDWGRKYPWLALPGPVTWEERIIGHYAINSDPPPEGRARCGRYRDSVVKALRDDVPDPAPLPGFPSLPAWLPADYFRLAFPLADPAGAVTETVIAWLKEEGQVPWFLEKIDVGAGRNIWRFDLVTIFSNGAKVWLEGKEPK